MSAKKEAEKMKNEIFNATSEFISRLTTQKYKNLEGTYIQANLWVPQEAAQHLAEVAIAYRSCLSLEELTDFVCVTIFTEGVRSFQQKQMEHCGCENCKKKLQESGIENTN
jgi:predicted transcriptional regulator of viral defense system